MADPPTLATGTAGDLSRLFVGLATGRIISPNASSTVLGWLAAGADLSMVAAGFGLDPLSHVTEDRGIVLRNKTGTDRDVRIDTGVVTKGDRGLAYAVLAEWDPSTDRRDEVLRQMHEVGTAMFGFLVAG